MYSATDASVHTVKKNIPRKRQLKKLQRAEHGKVEKERSYPDSNRDLRNQNPP
jgi:hypothetical protein